MSFRNSLIFLAIINISCFHFGGFRIGMISCFVTLYKILSYLGLTTTPQIFQNHFRPGVCYIKDFTGPYSSHGPKFGECAKLIKDNNLRDFSVIAFYYDDPLTVPKEKLRCSIGLYKKSFDKEANIPKEIDESLLKLGYRKHELEDAKAIYSSWDYSNLISMIIGIKKFYSLVGKKFHDKNFLNAFKIKEDQIKVSIEVYEEFYDNNTIYFYVPFENAERFLLYQKDQ